MPLSSIFKSHVIYIFLFVILLFIFMKVIGIFFLKRSNLLDDERTGYLPEVLV